MKEKKNWLGKVVLLIAVIAAVSGASAAISDEEDGLEENA